MVVEGGDSKNAAQPIGNADDDSALALVSGWDVGIEDNADYAAIELFFNVGGFFEAPGNNTGILLKGIPDKKGKITDVKNSVVFDVHAELNTHAGIMLTNTMNSRLSNFDARFNEIGVLLTSSDGNLIGTATMADNNKYGIRLLLSSHNTLLDCNGTENNTDVGILLGCGPEVGCGITGSNNNRITDCGGKNSTVAGILVDQGNNGNIVAVTHNLGNPAGADMVDNNPGCGTDLWYNNEGTGNQECVTLNP